MKRIMIAAALLVATSAAVNAQTEKGNFIIGAQLANINGDLKKDAKQFNFAVSPRVGWFIVDDLAVGAKVDLGMGAREGSKPTFDYGFVPFARYYFPGAGIEVVNKTRFFAEGAAGVGGQSVNGSSTTGFRGGATAGLAYFVSSNVALEGSAGVNIIAGSGSTSVKPGINLGFQIHLPTKKLKEMRGDIK